jgi:hypothetical protein
MNNGKAEKIFQSQKPWDSTKYPYPSTPLSQYSQGCYLEFLDSWANADLRLRFWQPQAEEAAGTLGSVFLSWWLHMELRSCYIAQAGLELQGSGVLLPWPPDYRCITLCSD